MERINVNLIDEREKINKFSKAKARAKFYISPILIAIIFAGSFILGRVSQSEAASFALSELNHIPIFGQVSHLVGSPDRKLIGEAENRINILLIGMGGEGHDGPNLTDTIILASLQPENGQVAMLSIPRDLLVPVENRGWKKINAVNAYGELTQHGRGGDLVRKSLEGLLGIDIPYYVRIDFQGFKSVIDAIGGIDVYVDKSFTDRQYPTYNHTYQTVAFTEGWQHLDGETALQYSRSRHGNNSEGNDFARSIRQQKVIASTKQKMMSFKTFSSPSAVTNTLSALQSNIATNLSIGEILRLARIGKDINRGDINHKILDNSADSPLTDRYVNGAYVLLPKNDDWTQLRDIALNLFEEAKPPNPNEVVENIAPPILNEKISATIEIQNGNGKSGGAREVSGKLSNEGFKIIKIGNADSFDYENSIIKDLTGGNNPTALKALKKQFPGARIADNNELKNSDTESTADFIVILGTQ